MTDSRFQCATCGRRWRPRTGVSYSLDAAFPVAALYGRLGLDPDRMGETWPRVFAALRTAHGGGMPDGRGGEWFPVAVRGIPGPECRDPLAGLVVEVLPPSPSRPALAFPVDSIEAALLHLATDRGSLRAVPVARGFGSLCRECGGGGRQPGS